MALRPLDGFRHFTTCHCVTGSMRHIYAYHGYAISEEMLLGLGGGVSFSYWHFKGQTPFMGGRGGFRPPLLEEVAGRRTGVAISYQTTSSSRRGEKTLLEMLEAGQPVMIQCDMGFLPYFDFGDTDYHFGWHVVVVCGFDGKSGQVLIADRDEELHAVSLGDLARARGSTFKPFPPKHKWYTFDFSPRHAPGAADARRAIAEQAIAMLEPPISNVGVKGIRKAARSALKWPERLSEEELRFTLFNSFIFIDAQGGTGGGLFRYMFSRFLREVWEMTGDDRLAGCADGFQRIGDRWQEVAELFKAAQRDDDPARALPEIGAALLEIADLEQSAWEELRSAATV